MGQGRVAGRPETRGGSQRNGATQLGRGEGGSASVILTSDRLKYYQTP
jgi:hypothetical protein